jgi:predicted YcjX-like family ATPase
MAKSQKKVPRFPWELIGHNLRQNKSWEKIKTVYSSSYRCSFQVSRQGKNRQIDLSIMDIPGERLADLPMAHLNYEDWADMTFHQLENHSLRHLIAEPLQAWSNLDQLSDSDTSTSIESQLLDLYRAMTSKLVQAGIPVVSPSSALVRHDDHKHIDFLGHYIPASSIDEYRDKAIFGLSEEQTFLPLPNFLRQRFPKIAKTYAKNFEEYKKVVVAPLVNLLRNANRLILAMDITGTLVTGPIGREAVEHLLSSACRSLNIGSSPIYRPDRWFTSEIEKVALVATKADTIQPKDRKAKSLTQLIKPLMENAVHSAEAQRGTQSKIQAFEVSAIRSSIDLDEESISAHLLYRENEKEVTTAEPESIQPPAIPKSWREADQALSPFPCLVPQLPNSEQTPPQSINVDEILNFLLDLPA